MTELEFSRTNLRRAKAVCLEWDSRAAMFEIFAGRGDIERMWEIKQQIRQRHWSQAMALILADALIRS